MKTYTESSVKKLHAAILAGSGIDNQRDWSALLMTVIYKTYNHNGVFLGEFTDALQAKLDMEEYTYQTENYCYVQATI
jgi:hypothetical protein